MISESLIDEDVWAEAPDGPEEAFLFLCLTAREKLEAIIAGTIDRGRFDDFQWRQQYITELHTIAGELGVSGFSSLGVYLSNASKMDEFDIDLAQKITRYRARNRSLLKADSVQLSLVTKQTVKDQLEKLRAAINASNLSQKLKGRLHKKVDAVEKELEKRRSALPPFWVLAGSVAVAFPTTVSTVAELPAAIEAVETIVQKVNGEKLEEETDETFLLAPPPLQIEHQSGDEENETSEE